MSKQDFSQFDQEIISTRIFRAPVDRVFKAWSDPTLLSQWWGPHGFTNTFKQFQFAPGGEWNFVMHGPNGANYENQSIFRVIELNRKIIFDHVCPPYFTVHASFDSLGDRTKLNFRMLFENAQVCSSIKNIAIDGNEQNFERLDSVLQQGSKTRTINPDLDLILEKVVDIPPHLLWKAWTNPLYLKQGFCPKPWSVDSCELDVRPGGKFEVVMLSPDGQKIPTGGRYLEVVENSRLVWTDAMTAGYRQGVSPFMTATIMLEPHPQGTRYRAVATHRTIEDKQKHEAMGFTQGRSTCLEQMVEIMKKTLD